MTAPLPSDLDAMLDADGFYADPYPAYARLRSEAPVYRHEPSRTWLVSGYDDVEAVFRSPQMFSSYGFQNAYFENMRPRLREAAPTLELRGRTPSLGTSDPPEHTRLRRLLQGAFSPKVMQDLRPDIQSTVDDLLEARAGDQMIDFVEPLAYPLPAMIIADLMGVTRTERDLFKEAAGNILRFMGSKNPNADLTVEFAREADESLARLRENLRGLVDERRRQPRDDVITAMVEAEFDGDRLDEEEILNNLMFFLAAGHETTTSLIGNELFLLLRHPDQLQLLRDDRAMVAPAIEEILRFEAPVQRLRRVVTHDAELGGVTLPESERVEVLVGSANRDEGRWVESDRFDIAREPLPNLAFARGPHFCIGAALARLEGTVAFNELLDRFPQMELDRDWQPSWAASTISRTLKSLPVRVA